MALGQIQKTRDKIVFYTTLNMLRSRCSVSTKAIGGEVGAGGRYRPEYGIHFRKCMVFVLVMRSGICRMKAG